MKWLRRLVIALVILAGGVAITAKAVALGSARPVGFQLTRTTDAGGKPFAIGVWYPTEARTWPTAMLGPVLMDVARDAAIAGSALPLVVISHGNGGGPPSHADLAMALASAGYVVAAPMHPGDNFADQSAIGSANFLVDRTRQLRATVDHMLGPWQGREQIDAGRIGAFGFSAGGFTVLASVGARPDLGRVGAYCAATPEFVCDVLRAAGSPLVIADTAVVHGEFEADERIGAAVVAAPGLGFLMDSAAIAGLRVPVQLWSGDADDRVPYATNAKVVREAIGEAVEFHSVPGAGHLAFLVPCGPLKPPAICTDADGFDRKAFHTRMNADIVAFFGTRLRKP
jgi:predicted dienelactone hydrolase